MEELTNEEKRKVEEAFNLLIEKEGDIINYSELLHKLEVYKRK